MKARWFVLQFRMEQEKTVKRIAMSPINRSNPIRYQQFQPKGMLQRLSFMLIRPPKLLYDPRSLRLSPYNMTYKYQVHNIPFQLSLYLPTADPVRYVVLYLHCNSSNRLEGSILVKSLPAGVGLACFDFEGCGIREGKWITLGVQESTEVDVAAKWIKEKGYEVVGWGRSMGSVSLLMSNQCSVMVADSPFSDLNKLCKESGQHIPYVPHCLYLCFFPCVFCCVRRDIISKTSCDIVETLDIEKRMANTDKNKSILFMSGDKDEMINKKHSERLFEKFMGDKKLLIFEGNHNSERTQKTYEEVFQFIEAALKKQKQTVTKNDLQLNTMKFQKTADILTKKSELQMMFFGAFEQNNILLEEMKDVYAFMQSHNWLMLNIICFSFTNTNLKLEQFQQFQKNFPQCVEIRIFRKGPLITLIKRIIRPVTYNLPSWLGLGFIKIIRFLQQILRKNIPKVQKMRKNSCEINKPKMSKIENLIDILKKESFRFHERIQTNMNKFSLADQLLPLFLGYQLFMYSLHQVIINFDNNIFNGPIEQMMGAGLSILQAQDYSVTFHTAVSCASTFVVLLFVLQSVAARLGIKSRLFTEFIDFMLLIGSFLTYISPIYFIIVPYHLINLFTGECPAPFSTINFILLPFYLLFLGSCTFLQYSRSLITPFHLLIPIFDYLGYDKSSLNGMIAGCAFLSYIKVLHGAWLHRMLNMNLILLNVWGIMETVSGQYNMIEEIMMLVMVCWVLAAYFVACQGDQNQEQQIDQLEFLIKSIEKPETQKREHYVETVFIQHFLNCEAKEESFCAGYASAKQKKLLLQMTREQLMNMLEEKIEVEFHITKKQELEIRLSEFRFLSKTKYLKLYKEAQEKSAKSQGKSFVQAYEHYKMMSKFQRRLEKESSGNLVVFERMSRAAQQDKIFTQILKQLYRMRSLWDCCVSGKQNYVQWVLSKIIISNQIIQSRYKSLSQKHYINNHKQQLYQLYCQVFSQQKFSNNHSTLQLASQQQLPIYLICSGQTIQKVSRSFQTTYHYNEQQLRNLHVNVLLPKVLHTMHQQKFQQWSGAEITERKQKFLVNGRGYIDMFGFTLLIYPDFQMGLRYIAYLEPSPQDKRIFLYNIKDDHFEKWSQEFKGMVGAAGFAVEAIDEMRCQDLFNGVDLKNSSTRERLKNAFNCSFYKQKGTSSMSIRLISEYVSGSGHFALVTIIKDDEGNKEANNGQKSMARLELSKVTTQKLKLQERVTEIKEQIRQQSKLVWKIFTLNILLIVIIAGYFTYVFVSANMSSSTYFSVETQTQLKLQIRLLFSQIVLRNTQLYTINLPSNIPPALKQTLIDLDKSVISDRVDRVNSDVLQRLSDQAHYQMLQLIEQITDDQQEGNIDTILGSLEEIQGLLQLPASEFKGSGGLEDRGIGMGIVLIVIVVFMGTNMVMSVKIEALIPKLKSMFMATSSRISNQKIKEVEATMKKFDFIEDDRQWNELQIKLKNQEGKSSPTCSSAFCRVLLLNILIIIICLSCIGAVGGLSGLQETFRTQQMLIDRFQNYFFERSIQMVRLVLFTNLHFQDMHMNTPQPSPNFLRFLSQISDMNTNDPTSQSQFRNLNSIFSSISDTAWLNLNKNICNSTLNTSSLAPVDCKSIAGSVLTYGEFKSIIRLQLQLHNINLVKNYTERYDDGILVDSLYLSHILAQYNRQVYIDYTNQIRKYEEQCLRRNTLVYVVLMAVVGLYVLGLLFDKAKKNGRVNLLKELFVLIPCEEFEAKCTVRVFTAEEDILEIIKYI